jgi:peptidoglycan/xylan/chitin deacetylase (PgdA/CDA1 family)
MEYSGQACCTIATVQHSQRQTADTFPLPQNTPWEEHLPRTTYTGRTIFAGIVIHDYYLHSMSLSLYKLRIPPTSAVLLIMATALGGCGERRPGTNETDPVDTRSHPVSAQIQPENELVLRWRPVVETVAEGATALSRLGAKLGAALIRDLAALCRLDGWNQQRTIGYRERAWELKRRTGPKRTRRLVLTFDDGPMKKKTPKILDLLAKHQVKATFFVVGRVIHAGTYRIVRRILKEGHTLANHSYHHLVDMHKHPRAADLIEAELELGQAMVDLALLARSWRDFRSLRIRMLGGKKFGFARTLPDAWPAIRARWHSILRERSPDGLSPHRMVFVRPPGGAPFSTRWRRHHREQYAQVLRKLGLINVMWDSDSGDSDRMLTVAERRDPGRLMDAILEGTKRGGVFLMHDRIGLGGFGQALRHIVTRKRVVITDLPAAAGSWYGCEPRTLSLVMQTLHALDYRAPRPPVTPGIVPRKPVVRKRRRRSRRVRKRTPGRVQKRFRRRPEKYRDKAQGKRQRSQ